MTVFMRLRANEYPSCTHVSHNMRPFGYDNHAVLGRFRLARADGRCAADPSRRNAKPDVYAPGVKLGRARSECYNLRKFEQVPEARSSFLRASQKSGSGSAW